MNKNFIIFITILALISISYLLLNGTESIQTVQEENKETADETTSLHPVTKDGLVGFINQDGKMIIEATFNRVITKRAYKHDELIPVKKTEKGKVGFIDKTGEFVIEPKFEAAFPFQEELAMVLMNGKVGYIGKKGHFIVEPTYSLKDFPFSEGIEMTFFNEGLAAVQVEGKGWGYIDKSGAVVIEPQFEFASRFSEGVAFVKVDGLYGFIDKSGSIVIDAEYEHALPFSEGVAAVKKENKYGYINNNGEFVIEPQFDIAKSFTNDIAPVFKKQTANGGETDLGISVGYINREGELVIDFQYEGDEFSDFTFNDGLAIARSGLNYGFINTSGEVKIPFSYEQVYPFSYGLSKVVVGDRESYINTEGKVVYSSK
ncbi:WG repeat-containing protein [Lottiidibacillus patelloidae]|nr:WG repeat-containing protein [Lottiidibacillus patelloidae]